MIGPPTLRLSPRARQLILDSEGVDQPTAWPGGDSGVSIGVGYDLGQVTSAEFAKDWKSKLQPADFARLNAVIGLKGEAAHSASWTLNGIVIPRALGLAVFDAEDVPQYTALTAKTFPGSVSLPADAFGALVSLVFNRGQSLDGDRRVEMLAIVAILAQWSDENYNVAHLPVILASIAAQLRSMKRLWSITSGLFSRREREAKLVEIAAISLPK